MCFVHCIVYENVQSHLKNVQGNDNEFNMLWLYSLGTERQAKCSVILQCNKVQYECGNMAVEYKWTCIVLIVFKSVHLAFVVS